MPPPAYTQRLFGGEFLVAGGGQLVYRAPSVGRVVVRDIAVTTLAAAGTVTVRLIVNPAVRAGSYTIWLAPAMEAVAYQHIELRQALEPNDTLVVNISAAPVHLAVTGYVFTA